MIHNDTVFSLFTLSSIQPIKMRNTERHWHIYPYACVEKHPLFVEQILVLQQENDSETIDLPNCQNLYKIRRTILPSCDARVGLYVLCDRMTLC